MKTAKEHNRNILSKWENEMNSKNAKAWAGITIDENWQTTIYFVDVSGIDLPTELRKIADILENKKKKGGSA